ncbi:MAG: type I-U CRISPR-associated protein Cas7 [Candidatus Binatia bacterium]
MTLDQLLTDTGPRRLTIAATLKPTGDQDRFQPAGFPEIGHVIYDAPRSDGGVEKVCIVDSSASMANHLEKVCWDDAAFDLVLELAGLPYVRVVTDLDPAGNADRWQKNGEDWQLKTDGTRPVFATLTEGHRLASDYFLDSQWRKVTEQVEKKGKKEPTDRLEGGREVLKREFGTVSLGKEKTFTPPTARNDVLKTICKYDPNSLVHGVFFSAFKDIKIPRVLTAHLEAFGAARVDYSGVKFDPVGKTVSGQPIFQSDDSTAHTIRATFIIDLQQIRSFGRTVQKNDKAETLGLSEAEKKLILGLSLWKILKLFEGPWRYRSRCDLALDCLSVEPDSIGDLTALKALLEQEHHSDGENRKTGIQALIAACAFTGPSVRIVYYPAGALYKEAERKGAPSSAGTGSSEDAQDDQPDDEG